MVFVLISKLRPRKPVNEAKAKRYAALLAHVFPPIVVRPSLDLADGHHRLRAAVLRGDKTIRAIMIGDL